MSKETAQAIRDGMSRSILTALHNGTDTPCADLLDAIKEGVAEGIFRAAMAGAFEPAPPAAMKDGGTAHIDAQWAHDAGRRG